MTIASAADQSAFEGNVRKTFVFNVLMDFPLWLPIWVLYLRDELGFSLTQVTLLDVPFFLLVLFAEVPTGAVADRFGRKYSMMLGAGFYAVAVAVLGVADNYIVVLVSYAAWGLSVTFRSGADTALLFDSMKEAGREADFPNTNGVLYAARSTALLAGLLLGAPLAAATSFSFTFEISALIAAAAFVVAWTMHEPAHSREHAQEPYFRTLAAGLHEAWRKPALRYVILYAGIMSAGVFGPLAVFQQPWLAEHGVTTSQLGLWQAPARGAAVFSALIIGWLLVRVGERTAFFALPVTLTACTFALAGIDHAWVAVAFIGMGFVSGMQDPFVASYVNHRIDSKRRATVLSVQNVVQNLILAGMQPIGGVIADAFGLQAVFLMFGTSTLVFGGAAVLLWDRADRRDQSDVRAVDAEATAAG